LRKKKTKKKRENYLADLVYVKTKKIEKNEKGRIPAIPLCIVANQRSESAPVVVYLLMLAYLDMEMIWV